MLTGELTAAQWRRTDSHKVSTQPSSVHKHSRYGASPEAYSSPVADAPVALFRRCADAIQISLRPLSAAQGIAAMEGLQTRGSGKPESEPRSASARTRTLCT